MNKAFKIICIGLAVALSVPAASYVNQNTTIQVEAAKKVALSKTSIKLIKGYGYTLKLNNNSKKVSWSSSNKSVATVTSKGYVKGMKTGTVKIYAKVSGKTYSCTVKVETPSISKTSFTMYKGKTYKLSMKGNTQSIKWSSSNTKVAKVSSSGTVTGVSSGTTTIKAKIASKTYSSKVTVKNPSFSVNTTSISVDKGKTYTIKASTSPSATVSWKSSNTSIATVSSKGVVTGKSGGYTTITAKANGITKYIGVKVNAGTFTLDTSNATIGRGGKITVTGKVSPYAKVTWKTSNANVAYVDGSGTYVNIYGKANGSATITASANGVTRTIKITVTNPYFNAPSSVSVNFGSTAKINVSASPKPSYIAWKNIDYNISVASIGSDGVVKGNYVGKTKMYAEVNGIKRTIEVTVKNPKAGTYEQGYYKVGTDIPAGEYLLSDYGNSFPPAIATYKDGTFASTANTVGFRKNMFATLKTGQYIKLTGCKATLAPAKYTGTGTGAYRVGKDITAGTYKITRTNSTIEGLCNLFATSDLSTNNVMFSTKRIDTTGVIITVQNGQVLSLVDAKATRIN